MLMISNMYTRVTFDLHVFARKQETIKLVRHQHTLIMLSAFSFAAINYQLSIVSTHFAQRQQTSTYGMISYTFIRSSLLSVAADMTFVASFR